jgi:hypothetical protein
VAPFGGTNARAEFVHFALPYSMGRETAQANECFGGVIS